VHIEWSATPPAGWDTYVTGHPLGVAYHRGAAVQIGSRCFGLRTVFLTARNERGEQIGALPLVEQSSTLFGRFLSSVPFFTYGGILADDESVSSGLAEQAIAHARLRRADHVELRHTMSAAGLDLAERLDKVSMVLSLPTSVEALDKRLGSKLRSQVRRAEREQIDIRWGAGELLEDFYAVFAPAMHQLGTPVYPRRFFAIALEALGELASVLVVRMRGEPHAAGILVKHPRSIEVPWAAATAVGKAHSVNMRMYWEMLRFAIDAHAGAFDFGRSSVDSGTYRFKAQWGAKPVQLHWHYWLPAGAPVPKLNQSNPTYARAAVLWRRMPLWCANILGPYIVRNLP
jgi:FemAB-related protein (PEP-CTERM system-associated)